MSSSLRTPYLSRLEGGGLQPGQTVVIKGLQTGDTFNVLFLTSQHHETADVAFSFTVHQKDKHALLNDRKDGKWGKEEKKKDPFKEGEPIDLRIRCHDNKFDIFCNLKEIATFEYRQALSTINHIYIDGGIDLGDVNWGGKYYSVPYQAGIDGGFTTSKKLFLSAIPDKKADQFSINLVTDTGDVAFHFNPRFGKKSIVRNSYLNKVWGTEESEGKFPLAHDVVFDVMVVNEPYALQIFVNGNHFCSFAHRVDPNHIKGLKIEGDVVLMGVHVS
jgi:hypothetical protein